MKKVFLEDLPKWEKGNIAKEGTIKWEQSIGHIVHFIYNNIEGNIKITDCFMDEKLKRKVIMIKYLDNEPFKISCGNFVSCVLGGVLGIKTTKYKYKIGDIAEGKFSKIEIIKQIQIKDSQGKVRKGYEYKCLTCGNTDMISEGNLKNNRGCNVCCIPSTKILKGYNDIATTHPLLIKYFVNIEDAYKHSYNSIQELDFICPDCGNIQRMSIENLCNWGFSCKKCSDGTPYPEKFMFSILEQLGLDFKTQLTKTTFKWCDKYRYDFYFEFNREQYICEINGRQHYEDAWNFKSSKNTRNYKEEQENDKLKKKLALNNGIKENNYIVIDCRYSNLEWIRDNKDGILNSTLNELFNLSMIDWNRCNEFAISSRIKEASNLWNNGIRNTKAIGKIMKLHDHTICRYLKIGKEQSLCDYDSKIELASNSKSIICTNNNIIFESIIDCERKSEEIFGIKFSTYYIRKVLNGKLDNYKGFCFKYKEAC